MIHIRKIEAIDNVPIAKIVSQVMQEFGADPKTTVLGDPSLHTMYENYQLPGSVYYVVELDHKIVGGCGIKQLDGSKENICELQRMFLLSDARGKGIGKKLLQVCLEAAKQFDYKRIYLESLSQMKDAAGLYEYAGFTRISNSLGNTGHGGCNVFMILDIE